MDIESGSQDSQLVSSVSLSRLLPLVPVVLLLLQETTPNAADLFFSGAVIPAATLNQVTLDLLNILDVNGDLTLEEVRQKFGSYPAEVWISLVRELLTGCWPRIIPSNIAYSLLDSVFQLQSATSDADIARVIGPLLDDLTRVRYRVLAEFCAFVRGTSSQPEDMACLCGPSLFCPDRTMVNVSSFEDAAQMTAISAFIMDMLIQKGEIIFGRVGCSSPAQLPLGGNHEKGKASRGFSLRRSIKRLSKRGTSSGGVRKVPTSPTKKANGAQSNCESLGGYENEKTSLRVFYQWRDPKRSTQVDLLFKNYEFSEIALAIQKKYYVLPPGWKLTLDHQLTEGKKNLEWFVLLKQGQLPAPTVDTIQDPASEKVESTKPYTLSKVDKIISEIASTEQFFNDSLNELLNKFVHPIKSIADGVSGKTDQKALGVTSAEIDHIFGMRLYRICDVSNTLLSSMGLVTLVTTQPKNGQSRIGIVAKLFLDISDQLKMSFSPYATGHQSGVNYLQNATQNLGSEKGKLRKLGSFLAGEQRKNFMDIWDTVSSDSATLKGQSIESVLIMPIQRVPRYKLLLEELLKATPESDPCYEQLSQVCTTVTQLASTINEEIRTQERIIETIASTSPTNQGKKKKSYF